MIAVVVAARNEEMLLPHCLAALGHAATHLALEGEVVEIVIVLDACTDASADVVAAHRVIALQSHAGNVGVARHLGAMHALERGARWLAFTDADTIVAADWLVAQLGLRAAAVCGTVQVSDWDLHPTEIGARFREQYQDRDDHRHVHGANLGLSRESYLATGGFEALEADEDVSLVRALEAAGIAIAWSAAPRVVTSSRLDSRAPAGFAAAIRAHYDELGVPPAAKHMAGYV